MKCTLKLLPLMSAAGIQFDASHLTYEFKVAPDAISMGDSYYSLRKMERIIGWAEAAVSFLKSLDIQKASIKMRLEDDDWETLLVFRAWDLASAIDRLLESANVDERSYSFEEIGDLFAMDQQTMSVLLESAKPSQ